MPINDHSVGIQLCADHGVTAWLAINSEIKCDGLMAVGALYLACRQDSEHGPKRMGDRSRLWEIAIAQQNAHTIGASTAWTIRNLINLQAAPTCLLLTIGMFARRLGFPLLHS